MATGPPSRLTACWRCAGGPDVQSPLPLPLPLTPGGWIRLDAIGGVAGDMFVAAAVATWPELAGRLRSALERLRLPFAYELGWPVVNRGGITARQFVPVFPRDTTLSHPTGSVAEIKAFIQAGDLSPEVRRIAIGLFDLIAAAEGEVHGRPANEVHLHEIADWDSIVDLVAAAVIIDAVGPVRWVCPSLPLGGGTVRCAHGLLPVPAPATAILCRRARLHDDGIEGERVTPTGAAILAYLGAFDGRDLRTGRLVANGYGAGSKELPGVPNVLRMLVFADEAAIGISSVTGTEAWVGLTADQVAVVSCDIDDQAPEDLAIGLDRLRSAPGVLSVTSGMTCGKKGRLSFRVEMLVQPAQLDAVAQACFRETTTIGLRWRFEDRWTLVRQAVQVSNSEQGVAPVKIAWRPDGTATAKVEADYLAGLHLSQRQRDLVRQAIESQSLAGLLVQRDLGPEGPV